MDEPRTIGVFLFESFELLDAMGPVQMLAAMSKSFRVKLLGPSASLVTSGIGLTPGPRVMADDVWETNERLHIILVPGGMGTRKEVDNQRLLTYPRTRHECRTHLLCLHRRGPSCKGWPP